jgi:type VI secretion system secreted protein Hcp
MFSYRAAALAIAFLLTPALTTTAYLQLPGITGESTDTKHKHWIEIESVSMGVHSGGGGGTASGGRTGKTTIHEIHVTKVTDQSSPLLMQAVASGKHFPTAEIDMSTVHYVMKDVILTALQHTGAAGGGDGKPTESITMNYQSIQYEYTPQNPDAKGTSIAAAAPRPMAAPVTPAPATPGTSMRAASASAATAPAAVSRASASSAATLESQLTPSLGPSTRSWVASEGRFLSQSNAAGSQLAAAARQAAKGTFPGAPDNVIEALTFLALMDAAKANHNEAQFQAAINQVMPLTSAAAAPGIASLK